MGTFNGEPWIEGQLQSIAEQTRRPDQLIVSDDGSTDRTLEIVGRFAASAPFPVQIRNGPKRGLAENFWSASSQCESELIAWSDQDDLWLPQKIELSERALVKNDAGLVSHSAKLVDEHLVSLNRQYPNYRSTRVFDPLNGDPWRVFAGFTVLLKKELLSKVNWVERPRSHQTGNLGYHDHAVSVLGFASVRRVELSEPLALYRQHSQNASGAAPTAGIRDSMQIGLNEYRELGEYAQGYRRFVESCGASSLGVARYYDEVTRRCETRARIYAAENMLQGATRLSSAVFEGIYGSRNSGRFRPAAIAKDAAHVMTKFQH